MSIGGSTGLFVGASLLSFIELIYYFTIRPYVNYRNERLQLQQQQRHQQQQQQQPQQQQQKPSSRGQNMEKAVSIVGFVVGGGGGGGGVDAVPTGFKWLEWIVELITKHFTLHYSGKVGHDMTTVHHNK